MNNNFHLQSTPQKVRSNYKEDPTVEPLYKILEVRYYKGRGNFQYCINENDELINSLLTFSKSKKIIFCNGKFEERKNFPYSLLFNDYIYNFSCTEGSKNNSLDLIYPGGCYTFYGEVSFRKWGCRLGFCINKASISLKSENNQSVIL